MTKRKKTIPTPGEQIAQQILDNYDLKDTQDIQDALKQIFDELKACGIEELGILSIDGVSGLEEGAKAIFLNITVQRCIVHLI